MLVPIALLVLLCLAVGLAPAWLVEPLVQAAARDVLGEPAPRLSIALWHGFNVPLAMSLAAFVVGLALYAWLARGYRLHRIELGTFGATLFSRLNQWSLAIAAGFTRRLTTGSLQATIVVFFLTGIALAVAPFMSTPLTWGTRPMLALEWPAIVLWIVTIAAALAAVRLHYERAIATLLVAAVGLSVVLTFVFFSAPDLALTQLAVEVVSTVLILSGLALLPQRTPRESSGARKTRDAVIAVVAGGGLAALAYAAMTRPLETLSWYYMANTVPKGGGANAVNVILVDFRGFDTLGEISVLGIAALGVAALLARLRAHQVPHNELGKPWSAARPSLLLDTVARWLLPFALLVSLYIFLRGHNAPGGGFIAGLITAVALVVQYMARGERASTDLIRLNYTRLIAWGLAIAGLTGIGSWFAGAPFLTSWHATPVLPFFGPVPVATASIFDFGVYLTVVGSTLLTLVTLARATAVPGSAR
jgi:multicomponent K+:H+ antiporter subunit A